MPAPIPIPTRRPDIGQTVPHPALMMALLDTQCSSNINIHLMTQYPYQDSDEDPLRHAYISLHLSSSHARFVSGLYATQSMSQRPCLAARVVSRKLTNLPSSIAPLPSFPPSSPFTMRLSRTQTCHLHTPYQHRDLLPQTPHGYHERVPQPNDASRPCFIFVPLLSRYGGAFQATSRRGSCVGLTSPSFTRTSHSTLAFLCSRRSQESLDARNNAPLPLRCRGVPIGSCHGPGNSNSVLTRRRRHCCG
jgi:hypothetical protein